MKKRVAVKSAARILRALMALVFASSIMLSNVQGAMAVSLTPSSTAQPTATAVPSELATGANSGQTGTSATSQSSVVATAPLPNPAAPTAAAALDPYLPKLADVLAPATPIAADASPTVVREIESSRTAESSTYLLSNGSYAADIYLQPIHYKDARGAWQNIDPSLVPTGTYGVVHTKASAYDETIASTNATAEPVTVRHGDWSLGMRLIGGEQSSLMTLGNTANYPLAMTDAQLSYETGGNAIKDTLTLSSKNAPASYTFFVSLDKLSLYTDPTGGYALYDDHGKSAGHIDPLSVFDSAATKDGTSGSVCSSATMTVASAPGGAYVTYAVPQSWLDDPTRVFPVKVDPQITYGGDSVGADTFVEANHQGNNDGGLTYLDQGWVGTNHTCRPLIRWNLGSTILQGATITAATMQLYCYTNTSGGSPTVWTYLVTGNAGEWGEGANWNSTFNSSPPFGYSTTNASGATVTGTGYKSWDVTGIAQNWWKGTANNGIVMMDNSDTSNGDSYRQFYSADYYNTSTSHTPHLYVTYTQPAITSASYDKSSYKPGDLVVASVGITSKISADAEAMVGLSGHFIWSASQPAASTGYVSYNEGSKGWFSYDPAWGRTAGSTVASLCPDLSSTTYDGTTRVANFVYSIGPAYGDVQTNLLYGYTTDFAGGCPTFNSNYSVLPASVTTTPSVSTTASANWYTTPSSPNNANSSGRASVHLSWSAAPSASSYNIYAFDGAKYDKVDSTTATTWSSAGRNFYPSDTAISNLTTGTGSNPFTAIGAGLDLRDDPRPLYQKLAGKVTGLDPRYFFKVVPANSAGESAVSSDATALAAPESRSVGLADEPQHTEANLGSVATHGAAAQLDSGALTLSSTDLEAASYGSAGVLSRTYNSNRTATGYFGPGWRFNFEQAVSLDATGATYTDEAGDAHRFLLQGSSYVAPRGMYASLSATGSAQYAITFKNRETLVFGQDPNIASLYHIAQDIDANSANKTIYTLTWTNGAVSAVSIAAPNGHQVNLSLLGAGQASATYVAGTVTRRVDYAYNSAAGTATAAYSFSDSSTSTVTPGYMLSYGYQSGRLVAATESQSAPIALQGGSSATWAFGYGGANSALSTVTAPYYASGQHAVTSLSYGVDSAGLLKATVTQSGEVSGTVTNVSQVFGINPSGTTAYKTNPYAAGDGTYTWHYGYDTNGEENFATNPDGATKSQTFDATGNTLSETDEVGNVTTHAYDATNDLVQTVNPLGGVTSYGIDPATGNVVWVTKQVGDTNPARTESVYDSHGRTTYARKLLFLDTNGVWHWATTYNIYDDTSSPFGSPVEIHKYGETGASPGPYTAENVALGGGNSVATLNTYSLFDAVGNDIRDTDASGGVTASAYDAAGHLLVGIDALGLATNHTSDGLGRETGSWKQAGAAIADYQTSDVDPFGRAITSYSWRTDNGLQNAILDRSVTRTFDAMGKETGSHDSLASGLDPQSQHDAAGNVIKSWAQGVASYTDVTSSRASFDPERRKILEYEPGTTASATVNAYNPDGTVSSVTQPDGSNVTYTYDAGGNDIKEHRITGNKWMVYDVGGRMLSETCDDGDTLTTHSYDLADREVSSSANGQTASTNTYNATGWVTSKTDADQVRTDDTYDAAGRTVSETIGGQISGQGKTTTSVYDLAGHPTSQTDPDLKVVTDSYDGFGRVIHEDQRNPSGVIKDVTTTYDTLSRTLSSAETRGGLQTASLTKSFVYPTTLGAKTTESLCYGDQTTTTTVNIDASGNETSRDTTISGLPSVSRLVSGRDNAGRITGWSFTGGVNQASTFDGAGHLARQSGSGFTSGAGDSDAYTYDTTAGRKIADNVQLAYGATIARSFGYNGDGRLATATVGANTDSFNYDLVGNINDYTVGGVHNYLQYDAASRVDTRLAGDGSTVLETYVWDTAHGWRTSSKLSNETTPVTYAFTGTGRLSTYNKPAYVRGIPASITATYTYDGLGQRTQSIVTSASATTTTTTTTTWTYDGLTLLSLSSVPSTGTTYSVSYLNDGDGKPYAGIYRSGTATATLFGMVTTDRGDVVALTDATGTPFASYRYDSWGRPLATVAPQSTALIDAKTAAAIASAQPLRYAGYVYDAENGMYYCSARHYDPNTMQWISKDPAKADREESAYQYCGGDPVCNADPSGAAKSANSHPWYDQWWNNTTWEEKALSIAHPLAAYWGWKARDKATAIELSWYGTDVDGGANNAFKHALWNALWVSYLRAFVFWHYSTWGARVMVAEFTTAHEMNAQAYESHVMDLHNNHLGREIGAGAWWQSDTQIAHYVLAAIKSGEGLMVSAWTKNGKPDYTKRLVPSR